MFVINNPKTGKSYKKEGDAQIFMGKKIRDKVDGNSIGLKGYELEITGGSDAQGFPMRGDLDVLGRKRPLVISGVGAKKGDKGMKQRKTVHGRTVDETINQLNIKIVKFGSEDLEKALGLVKEEPKVEEAPKEEPKVEEKKQ